MADRSKHRIVGVADDGVLAENQLIVPFARRIRKSLVCDCPGKAHRHPRHRGRGGSEIRYAQIGVEFRRGDTLSLGRIVRLRIAGKIALEQHADACGILVGDHADFDVADAANAIGQTERIRALTKLPRRYRAQSRCVIGKTRVEQFLVAILVEDDNAVVEIRGRRRQAVVPGFPIHGHESTRFDRRLIDAQILNAQIRTRETDQFCRIVAFAGVGEICFRDRRLAVEDDAERETAGRRHPAWPGNLHGATASSARGQHSADRNIVGDRCRRNDLVVVQISNLDTLGPRLADVSSPAIRRGPCDGDGRAGNKVTVGT